MKRVLLAVVAIIAWTGVTAYGAVYGWWLRPIAPRGDAQAFMQAATALAQTESKGNFALVLLRQGAVYAERYSPSIDPVDRDTRFPLASMSKWFTAYAVMQLVQAGRLDLDAPIGRDLTTWQLPVGPFDAQQVTIRRLLSHTAGLTDGLGFGDYLPSETVPTLQETLRHPRASADSTVVIAVGRQPGTEFQYSGGGYLILQALLEDVTGMPFATWMQDSVFHPIGMHGATYAYLGSLDHASRSFDARGALAPTYRYAAAGATGLSASARDLIAFAQTQLAADRDANTPLRRAALDSMRQPHGRQLGLDIWGLGVALYAPTVSGANVYGHDGANTPAINTSMRINPDNGDAVIVLVTGSPALATRIGSEWTLWQTGVVDFLSITRALRSAVVPWLLGLATMATLWGWQFVRRRRTLAAIALLSVTALSIAPRAARAQTAAPNPSAPDLPTVTLPSALDRVLRDFETQWRAENKPGVAALYTTDGFLLSDGRPPVRGRSAIAATTQASGALHLRALSFATEGDLGWIVGGYRWGNETVDAGKFVLLLRRDASGKWLIAADIDNVNRRARP